MANAGKKRAAPGRSSSGASSGKKLKLANKAKSSKFGGSGKTAVSSSNSSSFATKQKNFESSAASTGEGGIPRKKASAAANGSGKAVDSNVKKKVKGKGTLKEYVQDGNGRVSEEETGSGESDHEGDGGAVDVQDMLVANSDEDQDDEEFLQRSSFLTKLDKRELARCLAMFIQCLRTTLTQYLPDRGLTSLSNIA